MQAAQLALNISAHATGTAGFLHYTFIQGTQVAIFLSMHLSFSNSMATIVLSRLLQNLNLLLFEEDNSTLCT